MTVWVKSDSQKPNNTVRATSQWRKRCMAVLTITPKILCTSRDFGRSNTQWSPKMVRKSVNTVHTISNNHALCMNNLLSEPSFCFFLRSANQSNRWRVDAAECFDDDPSLIRFSAFCSWTCALRSSLSSDSRINISSTIGSNFANFSRNRVTTSKINQSRPQCHQWVIRVGLVSKFILIFTRSETPNLTQDTRW